MSAFGTSATLKRRGLMSASGLLSDISAKVLNSTEGAHLKNMSTFETDEHLRGDAPLTRFLGLITHEPLQESGF